MKRLRLRTNAARPRGLLLGLVLLLCVPVSQAEVLVITSAESPIREITVEQLGAIAMGQLRSLEDGQRVVLVDQSQSALVFHEFYYAILNMSSAHINSQRAKLIFTGRFHAPKRLRDDHQVARVVAADPELIGYVSTALDPLPEGVRVLMRVSTDRR